MAEQAVQTLLFPALLDKPLVATFDTLHQSSDGGAILLTAAAYVLLQALRLRLAASPAATHQVGTLRERLFKLEARVQVSARRIVLHLPSAFPWLALWQAVALALGVSPGERHPGPIRSIPCGLSLGVVPLAGLFPPRPAPP